MELRAHLRLLTAHEGGRRSPIASGYRPDVNFEPPTDHLFGVNIRFERELLYPGEEVDVVIEPRCPELWKPEWLASNAAFRVCEGLRVIAVGTVLGPTPAKQKPAASQRSSR